MQSFRFLLAMVAFAPGCVFGMPATNSAMTDLVEVESAGSIKTPHGWIKAGRAPADHMLELTFAVRQTHLPELQAALLAASDPASTTYSNWLSNEAVHALVAPAQASIDAVHAHLDLHTTNSVGDQMRGRKISLNSDFITQGVSVTVAEKVLNTTFYRYEHAASGHVVHRAERYALPSSVAAAIDFVAPSIHLPTIPTSQRSFVRDEARRRLQPGKQVCARCWSAHLDFPHGHSIHRFDSSSTSPLHAGAEHTEGAAPPLLNPGDCGRQGGLEKQAGGDSVLAAAVQCHRPRHVPL